MKEVVSVEAARALHRGQEMLLEVVTDQAHDPIALLSWRHSSFTRSQHLPVGKGEELASRLVSLVGGRTLPTHVAGGGGLVG